MDDAPQYIEDYEGSDPGPESDAASSVEGENNVAPNQSLSATRKGRVTGFDVIKGHSGAFSGFPSTVCGYINLNEPGPVNDTTTKGVCFNVHQMKFSLAGIPAEEVELLRKIVRTASGAAGTETKNGKDGPDDSCVLRPSSSLIAVADAPGLILGPGSVSISRKAFPIKYDADFELYVYDRLGTGLFGRLTYKVAIDKKSFDDQAPVNKIEGEKWEPM